MILLKLESPVLNVQEFWKLLGQFVKIKSTHEGLVGFDEMDAVVDRQEQYSWRSCLLVHGDSQRYGEKDHQHTTQSMDETIKPKDIDRSHRLASLSPPKMPTLLQ